MPLEKRNALKKDGRLLPAKDEHDSMKNKNKKKEKKKRKMFRFVI